jgi:hypothetical protein
MQGEIAAFIGSAIERPDFSVDPATYTRIALLSYQLSTGQAPVKGPSRASPFESFYGFVTDSISMRVGQLPRSENFSFYEAYIRTANRRLRLLSHLFGYCQRFRSSFVHFVDAPPINAHFARAFIYYLGRDSTLIGRLVATAISALDSAFTTSEIDGDLLASLVMIHSAQGDDGFYNNFLQSQVAPGLKAWLARRAPIDLPRLPKLTKTFYDFFAQFEPTTNRIFREVFFEAVIRPNLRSITQCLAAHPTAELLRPDSTDADRYHLQTLSLFLSPETQQQLLDFFLRFVKEATSGHESEPNVYNVARSMIGVLQMIDQFRQLIFDPTGEIEKLSRKLMSEGLEKAKFHSRYGAKYAIALAFIVHTFLKRGNAFKSTVQESHIRQLLSYVSERDIFIRHHQNNLFWRLATRSTIGVRHEIKFLESIGSVVNDTNIADCVQLIDEARERCEPQFSTFSYMTIKHSLAPRKRPEIRVPLPHEYEQAVTGVTGFLKGTGRSKAFQWIHGLATVECALKTAAGPSRLTISLSGCVILTQLVSGRTFTMSELASTCGVEVPLVEQIVRLFSSGKLVRVDGTKVSLNARFHQAKTVLADNWDPKVVNIKNVNQMREQCMNACIVRIMKGERMMRLQQLIEKVLLEMSPLFPTTKDEVRKCVQYAEANEYVEMADDDHIRYIE